MQEATPDPDDPFEDHLPSEVLDAAKAAFGARADGELMVLVRDSLTEDGQPASDHELHFEHEQLSLDVKVSVTNAGTSLRGCSSTHAPGRFEVMIEGRELGFVQDSDDGSFAFTPLGSGLVRLSFEAERGSRFLTDWFRI